MTTQSNVGSQFLNWQEALDGLAEVKRLPGALRLRATIDKGWRPGLWLARDHAAAAEPKPESRVPAESTAAVTEFGLSLG